MISIAAIPETVGKIFGITRTARIRRDLDADLKLLAALHERKGLEEAEKRMCELVLKETQRLQEWTALDLDGQRQWSSIIGGIMTLSFLGMIVWFIFWRPFDHWWQYPFVFIVFFLVQPVALLVIKAIAQKDHLPNGQ